MLGQGAGGSDGDEKEHQLRSTALPQTAREGGGELGHGEVLLGQGAGGGDGNEEENMAME